MNRRRRAVCGRGNHGKPSEFGGLWFAFNRPGSRDGYNDKWKHVGNGPYWADLSEWAMSLGPEWVHERNLVEDPLLFGECLCIRNDCVGGMYYKYRMRKAKAEKGSLAVMSVGQASPSGRYPSTSSQVRGLLVHTKVEGRVLDCCGARGDAVTTILTERGVDVTTNDFNRRSEADSHLDATSDSFRDFFSEDTRRPDWIVTSPPYKHAFSILKVAVGVASVGVAFKLRLSFLEPTVDRGSWFEENPPDKVVVLPRATYRGRKCCSTEAWFVWYKEKVQIEGGRQPFRFVPR